MKSSSMIIFSILPVVTSQSRVRSRRFITFIAWYLEIWTMGLSHMLVVQCHRSCMKVALRTRVSRICLSQDGDLKRYL